MFSFHYLAATTRKCWNPQYCQKKIQITHLHSWTCLFTIHEFSDWQSSNGLSPKLNIRTLYTCTFNYFTEHIFHPSLQNTKKKFTSQPLFMVVKITENCTSLSHLSLCTVFEKRYQIIALYPSLHVHSSLHKIDISKFPMAGQD